MKLLYTRPEPPGSGAIARVNVELDCGTKLFGLRVKRKEGRYLVYAPNAGGVTTASFPPSVVNEIAAATLAALEERMPDAA